MSRRKTEKKYTKKSRRRFAEIQEMPETKESRKHRLQKELFANKKAAPLSIQAPNKILLNDAELAYLLNERNELIKQRQAVVLNTEEKIKNTHISSDSKDVSIITDNLVHFQAANTQLEEIDTRLSAISERFFKRLAKLPHGLEDTVTLIDLVKQSHASLIATLNNQLDHFANLKFSQYSPLEAHRETLMTLSTNWIKTIQTSTLEIDEDCLTQLKKMLDLNQGRTSTVFISHDTERQVLPLDECHQLVDRLFIKSGKQDSPSNDELTRQIVLLRSCENLIRRIPINRFKNNLELIADLNTKKGQFENSSQQTESTLAALQLSYKQVCLYFFGYSPKPYQLVKLTETLNDVNSHNDQVQALNQAITATLHQFKGILDDVSLSLHSVQANRSLISCHDKLTELLTSRQKQVSQLTIEIKKANESLKALYVQHDFINRQYFDAAYHDLDNTLLALSTLYPRITTATLVVEKKRRYGASLNAKALLQNAKDIGLEDGYYNQLKIISKEYATLLDCFNDETTTLDYKKNKVETINKAADESITAILIRQRQLFRQEESRLIAGMRIPNNFIAQSLGPFELDLNETALIDLQNLTNGFSDLRQDIRYDSFSVDALVSLSSPYTQTHLDSLTYQLNRLHRHYGELITHDKQIENIQVNQLRSWLNRSDTLKNHTKTQQIAAKAAFQSFIKAEAKVRCPTFQLSLNLIEQLNDEIIRIMTKHIHARVNDVNPRFHANYNELDGILHNQELTADEIKQRAFDAIPEEYTVNFVNSIDNRLSCLMTIKNHFKQLNCEFIEHESFPTEQDYRQGLDLAVRNTLFHDHMEDMSDGKRSRFTQWLRRNLIKPLQNSTNWINRFIHRNDEHFFAAKKCTRGACHTERVLVQMGNDISRELAQPAAVAAVCA